MRTLFASVIALLASYALLTIGSGLFTTLLSIRSYDVFSTTMTGWVMAAYYFGLMWGGLLASRVIVRVGYIRSFAAYAAIIACIPLWHVLAIDPVVWIICRFISGFCISGLFVTVESWLNDKASNHNRGALLSLYMMTSHLASGTGQYLLNIADVGGTTLFMVSSMLFSISVLPLLLTSASPPHPTPAKRASLTSLYQCSPLGFAGVLCVGLNNAAFYSLASLFILKQNWSQAYIPTFISAAILGGMILQWPIGRLSDHFDRRHMMIGVSLIAALASAAIVVGTNNHWPFYVLCAAAALYGGTAFSLYSIASAHANDFATPEQRPQLMGGLLVSYGVGATIGPIIAAKAMDLFDSGALFVCLSFSCVALGLFAIYRMTQRATIDIADHSPSLPKPTDTLSEELYVQLVSEDTSVNDDISDPLAHQQPPPEKDIS